MIHYGVLQGADAEKLKKRAERFGVAVSSQFAEVCTNSIIIKLEYE
jgi:hypothetical protein